MTDLIASSLKKILMSLTGQENIDEVDYLETMDNMKSSISLLESA